MRSRLYLPACLISFACLSVPLQAGSIPPADRSLTLPVKGLAAGKTADGLRAGLRVDRQAFVAEDGQADLRQGVVGTLAISSRASLGIGLYRVSRYSRGEPNFKRLRPMEDVDGRHQRIAAVGMSIRF